VVVVGEELIRSGHLECCRFIWMWSVFGREFWRGASGEVE
jgi:hypothetical protein